MELYEEIEKLMNELTQSIKLLRKNGSERAQKEMEYKVCLRQEALKLRADEGMPVTLINQVIYGVPEVAEKRLKRDIAEATYTANQEHINVTKLKLRILESQLQREWGNVNNG